MKKYIILPLFALLAFGTFTSCSDILTVSSASNYSDDIVFGTPDQANIGIASIYEIFAENNSYRNRMWLQMGTNTDLEYRSGWADTKVGTYTKVDDLFSLYSANTTVAEGYNDNDANPWNRVYGGIERSNLAIEGIRTFGNPAAGNDMGQLLGEALTLRAFFFYDLIKWWGDVPARFVPVNADNIYVSKTNRDVIYDHIIADLQEASTLLSAPGGTFTATTQRISKDAARGLLARICLSAAGYSMRPDSTASDSIAIKITVSDTRKAELYTIARNACRDIITDGHYKLDSTYKTIFYQQCQNNVTPGREVIWQLPYKFGNRGRMLYNLGLPREADSRTGSHNTVAVGGQFKVMPSFFYDFDKNDTRRDITVVPYKVVKNVTLNVMEQSLASGVTGFNLGKWRSEWLSVPITGTDDGVAPIVLRYADVLLMFAEADLFLNGTEGADYFNQVRRRAFGQPLNTPSAYDLPLTLNNIKQERAFELCGENIRKYDLIRWGELKTKIDSASSNLTALRNGTGNYATVPSIIYYKMAVDSTIAPGERVLVIYGLNRGETDVKTTTDPTGGWVKKDWTKGISSTSSDFYLSDGFNTHMYLQNPDKRQLLPIMHQIILGSNGKLSNDYGYGN
jgi:hypothetical protein